MLNLVAAFVMVVAHQIMSTLENTQDVDAVLVNFWCLLPGYNFGEAIIQLTSNYYLNELGGTADFDSALGGGKGALHWDVTGKNLCFMCVAHRCTSSRIVA